MSTDKVSTLWQAAEKQRLIKLLREWAREKETWHDDLCLIAALVDTWVPANGIPQSLSETKRLIGDR